MFAKIIVDVPSFQTDRPYTYLVPEKMQDVVQVGVRVMVPFGNGNRLVEGFIVELVENLAANENTLELKAIQELLDITPVINSELFELASFMKKKTFGFKISCLQTMIPSLMKSKVEKYFYCLDNENAEAQAFFQGREKIYWKDVEKMGALYTFSKLREKKVVEVTYELIQKENIKTERVATKTKTTEEYQQILGTVRPNSVQQILLLESLIASPIEQFKVTEWIKEKNLTSAVIKQAQTKGWIDITEQEVYRNPYKDEKILPTTALVLNDEQALAKTKVLDALNANLSKTFLLEGITGSGKTEVYLQIIEECLQKGKSAIVLVPEISLTPMMNERFKNRFGDLVAILHSGLSLGEKYDEWRKVERGEAKVIVGARSAIFAPVKEIGVIIIDEEHESTYKQDSNPRYHARDVAIWRSEYHHCPLVLGSATPSLESRARAQKNVYELLTLTKRASKNATLPVVEVVDFREDFGKSKSKNFTSVLIEKIQKHLQEQNQIVLMLNKRGYSSFMLCRDCGFVLNCPNCDVSLTLHMDSKTMRCHYCGHEERIPNSCGNCGSREMKYFGTGTQQVEEELKTLFPQARVLRMDVDTTRKKGSHEKLLNEFGSGKADILLGTQMIAKGLDFENVTLVGVISADTSLNLPDFRSSEKTFQLLTQVSGRAGRGNKKGEVVIQTFNPEHYAIALSLKQDYESFYQKEMQMRHLADYPPFYYTIQVTVHHKDDTVAAKKIFEIYKKMKPHLSEQSVVLGPAPRSIARMKNQYYYQMLIKYKFEKDLPEVLEKIVEETQQEALNGLNIIIDNEPLNFL